MAVPKLGDVGLNYPDTAPKDSSGFLWSLQAFLLSQVEELLGPRESSKSILTPAFHECGPHIRHTLDLTGAFIELGQNARECWPLAHWQMAHEVVHLLNPVVGMGSNLEEGIATAFQCHVKEQRRLDTTAELGQEYLEVFHLVRKLPGGPFMAGRRVRSRCGSLSSISKEHLEALFPEVGIVELTEMARTFKGVTVQFPGSLRSGTEWS